MRYFDDFEIGELLMGLLLIAVVSVVLVVTSEAIFRSHESTRGTIIDKSYRPDTSETTAVPVVSSNGGVGVGVASSGHSEAFFLIAKLENGTFVKIDAGVDGFYKHNVGDVVNVKTYKGYFFGLFVKHKLD